MDSEIAGHEFHVRVKVKWALHGLNILTGFGRDELLKGNKGRYPSEEVNRAVWVRDSESLSWERGRWREGGMRSRVCLPLFTFLISYLVHSQA